MIIENSDTPGDSSSGVCFVIYPLIERGPHANPTLDPQARLEEAMGLARAIDLDIADGQIVKQTTIKPATFISSGHIDELKGIIKHFKVDLVVVDTSITPGQQRNLEIAWNCKVIDRTGLILEIFGERARTSEGKLQVELAALSYQRSRLVRSWTHLERQRGGLGFIGGPGESQLEIDRRLIDERITKIKKQLEKVVRTRGLQRRARERVPFPVVALVGYTNAGKSTLFNHLTEAQVMAKDILFATLDPTMRKLKLPSGREVILSDTVGFISDLPTDLVAAFRATLEEVLAAELILHVRDICSPNTDHQREDVMAVLANLGIEEEYEEQSLEVLNKIDNLDPTTRKQLSQALGKHQLAVSALQDQGLDQLIKAIDSYFSAQSQEYHLKLPVTEGKRLAWLYAHGEVLGRRDDEDFVYISVKLRPEDKKRYEKVK